MANKYIKDLSQKSTPVITDAIELDDGSTSTWARLDDMLKIINGLTADSSPDETADYLVTYDASASGPKKVLPNVLVTDAKIATSDITTNNASTSKHGWLPKIPASLLYRLSGLDGTWVQNTIYKSANETVNNSSTLQDDNALIIPVAANEILLFDMTLFITGANTTADFKCGWTVPSGTTMLWGAVSSDSTISGNHFAQVAVANTPLGLLAAGSTLSTATFAGNTGFKLSGLITVSSTPGNVTFQWAQNTLGATDLIVLKGSSIDLSKLAS